MRFAHSLLKLSLVDRIALRYAVRGNEWLGLLCTRVELRERVILLQAENRKLSIRATLAPGARADVVPSAFFTKT